MLLSNDIVSLRDKALATVEERAKVARQRVHSDKQDEYAIKLAESRDLSLNTPVIDAEAAARGIPREDMARLIIDAHKRSQKLMRDIAITRSSARHTIKQASETSDIARIRNQATTDLDSIGV